MSGSISDKSNTDVINAKVVSTAKQDYDERDEGIKAQLFGSKSLFVEIGINSTDPEYVELYMMMPQAMRDEIKKVWGTDGMYIRKNMVLDIFGFRKLSITQIEKINKPWLRKVENIWQEVMKNVKDAIVIKTGTVFVDNVLSNTSQLAIEGLNPSEIARYQVEGYDSLIEYLQQDNELIKLQINSDTVDPTKKDTKVNSRIKELEANLIANPVHELIEDGQFQTIMEDIDLSEKQFTYRSSLEALLSPYEESINPDVLNTVKKVSNQVFMTHETKIYELLKDMTQYSDFVARYALHKHIMKKGEMTNRESLRYIRETFVNYDTATAPLLQYANDMGLMAFTKFFLRTQKIILRNFIRAPLRLGGLFAIEGITDMDISTISDTGLSPTARMYNPFGLAADASGFHLVEFANNFTPDYN